MKNIITGSKAFFSGIKGFHPKDIDIIVVVDCPQGFNFIRQTTIPGKCIFEVVNHSKEQLMDYALQHGSGMMIGRFLTPEYAENINLTIEDLKRLEPMLNKLDDKHSYQKVIYEAYIDNGKFELTDGQREKAFEVYKSTRK